MRFIPTTTTTTSAGTIVYNGTAYVTSGDILTGTVSPMYISTATTSNTYTTTASSVYDYYHYPHTSSQVDVSNIDIGSVIRQHAEPPHRPPRFSEVIKFNDTEKEMDDDTTEIDKFLSEYAIKKD